MQIEQLLCWSGMTDIEHTISGSMEEVVQPILVHVIGSLEILSFKFFFALKF